MGGVFPIEGTDKSLRIVVDSLSAGWSTRSFPHLIDERALYVADNVVFNRDGMVSKRPGNGYYGGSVAGATGSGHPILSGARFYYGTPTTGKLVVQSNGSYYVGNDGTGAFTKISGGLGVSLTNPARYTQMYDPDMSTGAAIALIMTDGLNIPQLYDGTHFTPMLTGTYAGPPAGDYLPNGATGSPITPLFCTNWNYHLVLGGEPTDPTALYISDALRPERFNGYGLIDSAATPYTQYYPAGRAGVLGNMTGIVNVGPYLIIFFTSGIVTAINTGSYGAFQYEFATISRSTGAISPQSIVPFEGFVVFFGGDRFYATDGNVVVPLPDEIPSVYANSSVSAFPSEIINKSGVIGGRRNQQYLASYDNVGTGMNNSVVVFDMSANGGYTFGATQGGAWSRWPTGMPFSFFLECRGPGDNAFPCFWGSSNADLVAQHDIGTYADFGAPISIEIRGKAFFLDKPIWEKTVLSLYLVCAFPTTGATYTTAPIGYVFTDTGPNVAAAVNITANPEGTQYGTGAKYGTFTYGSANQIVLETAKTYPQEPCQGNSIQPGLTESSINPFNLIAFIMEVVIDEPAP
jgi:hypothetical protein